MCSWTPMPKCDFNKVVLHLYWNHTSAWVFSCKFAAYFQNTFSWEHFWMAASEYLSVFWLPNHFMRYARVFLCKCFYQEGKQVRHADGFPWKMFAPIYLVGQKIWALLMTHSSWKNAAECFSVALTLTLGGYESAIAPNFWWKHWCCWVRKVLNHLSGTPRMP